MQTLFHNVFQYRQMIFSLVHRDLRGRYKGSVLGFLWTFLNPLLQLFVYTFVFSTIMHSNIEKYYLFLFVALIPWNFFSSSLSCGCSCILDVSDMVKKIYFPREILPLSFVTSNFINMLYCFVVVFIVIVISGTGFNFIALTYLPLIMIIEYIFTLGITLFASAITVYLRDVKYILSILVFAWQMFTPVMFPSTLVPTHLLKLWYMNPMTPIVEAYRSILFYKEIPQLTTLISACGFGLFFIVFGEFVFSKLQKGFAEEL